MRSNGTNRLVGFWLAFLLGCGAASTIAGPERADPPVAWRGTVVTGVRPGDGLPILEQAWQSLHTSWQPTRWLVVLHEGGVPCSDCGSTCHVCGGVTDFDHHEIHLSWSGKLPGEATWELGNACHRDQGGHADDVGPSGCRS